MRLTALFLACSASFGAIAAPPLAPRLDALYAQMEPTRQSLDKERLRALRFKVDALNQQAATGPADTGCFDASGILRAMPINIEMQWDASTPEQANRQAAKWRELNTKYQQYATRCAAS